MVTLSAVEVQMLSNVMLQGTGTSEVSPEAPQTELNKKKSLNHCMVT